MTVRKIGVTVGDSWGATRAARYSLERAESPGAFASAGYVMGDEAALAQERPNVIWLGTEAALEKLGFERGAPVREEELALALQGLNADGSRVRYPGTRWLPTGEVGEDGKPVTVKELRVNSVDLTCSAPKSVSVVWSQAGPELRERIERAMFVSANAALEYMMGTKPVIQAKGIPAQGFAASAALQVTARTARRDLVPAPQLHVHGVVVGVDDGGEGLRSPDTAALFKDDAPLEGGAVFRARLAQELRAVGFELECETGRNGRFFEIAGVPEGLRQAMSPRTREVLEMVAQIELKTGQPLTGAGLGAVATISRAGKDKDVTVEQMIEAWNALAAEFGFGRESVEALLGRTGPVRPLEELRDQARGAILARIREQGPTVSVGCARAIAFQVAPRGLTLAQAGELLVEMQRSGELITLEPKVEPTGKGPRKGLLQVTTREIRSMEQEVIDTATAAATRQAPPLSAKAVDAGIAAANRALGDGKSLDDEQVEAIRTLTSGVGWATLTGRAGTGKGPVLEAVAVAYRTDGWQVIAGAADGATAQRLGHQVNTQALTIAQALYRESEGQLSMNDRTLVLIDEASKVEGEDWHQIAELVGRDELRVIPVGHAGQLGAIEQPGMFEQMLAEQAIPTVELTEIRRHRDPRDPSQVHPWLPEYQTLLDEGKGVAAVELLRKHKVISMDATRKDSMRALVDGWDTRRRNYTDPRDAIMVVHGPNEDVDKVNELAQQRRIAAKELGAESVRAADRFYRIHAGDVVMLRQSAYKHPLAAKDARRVENGTIGIVKSVDKHREVVTVAFDEPGSGPGGRSVDVDLHELRQRVRRGETRVPTLRLAYAFHPFPLQGATVKDVGVLGGHWSQDKEGTYTADTRAEWYLHVYLDRENLGLGGTDDDRYFRYGRRVTLSQERAASIAMNVSDQEVAIVLPFGEPIPNISPPISTHERADPPGRSPQTISDTLTRYRNVLGEARTDRLATQAERLGEPLRELNAAQLYARQDAVGDPFAHIDREGALATRRIERDQDITKESINASLTNAAAAQRELASRDLERLGRLNNASLELRHQGRHLDDWWNAHSADAAQRLAIDEELTRRREQTRALDETTETRIEQAQAPDAHLIEPSGLGP